MSDKIPVQQVEPEVIEFDLYEKRKKIYDDVRKYVKYKKCVKLRH